MPRALTILAAAVIAHAAYAEPSAEYVREAEISIIESAAIVEGEILVAPGEITGFVATRDSEPKALPGRGMPVHNAWDFASRVKVVSLLAGEGVEPGAEIDVRVTIPKHETCVGPPPTEKDHENYRAQWAGLFQPKTRWVFALERETRDGAERWRVRRAGDIDGAGRADVDAKLAKRRDLQEIAALLISLPKLNAYWQVDSVPERRRKPLILMHNDSTPRSLRLTKFGQAVLVVDRAEIEAWKAPFLEITELKIEGDAASAKLSYPAEGVIAEAVLAREGGKWVVKESKTSEK